MKIINYKYIIGGCFGFLISSILFGVVGVVAITLNANQITYTPANSSFKVTDTKAAVDELYRLSQLGNALSSDLLIGKEAFSAGKKIFGAMPDRGTLNWKPNGSEKYTLPSGYYVGGTLDSSAAYSQGYVDGQKNSTTNLDVVYTYHKHSSSCNDTCKGQLYATAVGREAYLNQYDQQVWVAEQKCGRCGAVSLDYGMAKHYVGQPLGICSVSTLSCGKTTESVESVTINYK